MAHPDPAQIRNVAVLGHRGSGKTSLVEAMLFAAGSHHPPRAASPRAPPSATSTTTSSRRGMSIAASLCHLTWQGVKVNLIDTPGEPSFQGDTLAALRAVDAVLMVVNATAGHRGPDRAPLEPRGRGRAWRARWSSTCSTASAPTSTRSSARLEELAPGAVAIQIPIGSEAGFRGVVNLVSMTATTYADGSTAGTTGPIPDELADAAQTAREHLIDVVAENDDALIEKYLEGEEITTEELIGAILTGVAEGRVSPGRLRAPATRRSASTGLLDLLVEALPSPATVGLVAGPRPRIGRARRGHPREDGPAVAPLLQDRSPTSSAAASTCCACSRASLPSDSQVTLRAQRRQGARGPALHAPGQGPRSAPGDRPRGHRRSGQAQGGGHRRRARRRAAPPSPSPPIALPPPLMSFAVTAAQRRPTRTSSTRRCGA